MMERIAAADTRIAGLADVLGKPRAQHGERHAEPVPDPAVLLQLERERVLAEAHAEGFAKGMREAGEEVQARVRAAESKVEQTHAAETERLRAANQRMQALLLALPDAVAGLESQTHAAAAEIAYAAVVRLLGERNADHSLIDELCRQALAESRQRPVVVRVAASHYAALSALDESEGVRIVADAELAPGQCRLETHKGVYESGLEIRLESLKQALLRGLATPAEQA